MANLGTKDGIFVVRFRYQGKEFKRSLKTRSEAAAKAALHLVELTLHRLHTGQLAIPEDVDPGDYVVSGGTWKPLAPPTPEPVALPTIKELVPRFLDARKDECAATYVDAQRYHLQSFQKFLGKQADLPSDQLTTAVLDKFLRKLRADKKDGETVNRYRVTLMQFFKWAGKQDDVRGAVPSVDDLPKFQGARDRDPFRTVEEIEAVLGRGGLDERQSHAQWESLYVDTGRLGGLLQLVRTRATDQASFVLHAIAAYTGMRRGEILRLRWSEVDLTHGYVIARSRKQSRSRTEVSRRIDLHPDLMQYLTDWKQLRPQGQFVVGLPGSTEQLNPDQANRLFWQPMRGTDWCLDDGRNLFKVGFHTYRHSFASNLAAAGIDQRVIDEFMGHTTDAMRKRYRHLFPKLRKSAIERLCLSSNASGAASA